MAVDLDDGGIDHGVLHVRLFRAGCEQPREHIGFDPVAEAFENGIPLAEEGRKITPWTAGPHDPKHRFDETAIITSAAPRIARLAEAMRFHLRPLGISQHESFHPKLESQPSLRRNPKSQQAPRDLLNILAEIAAKGAGFKSLHDTWADTTTPAGDAATYAKDYVAYIPSTLEPFGGRFLVRGGKVIPVEGNAPLPRISIIEFDSLDKAQAWYKSPAYQKLMPVRQSVMETNSFIAENPKLGGSSFVPAGPNDARTASYGAVLTASSAGATGPARIIAPCHPTKVQQPPSGPLWLHDIKHDGLPPSRGRMATACACPGNDVTYRFPLIVEALARLRSLCW